MRDQSDVEARHKTERNRVAKTESDVEDGN